MIYVRELPLVSSIFGTINRPNIKNLEAVDLT